MKKSPAIQLMIIPTRNQVNTAQRTKVAHSSKVRTTRMLALHRSKRPSKNGGQDSPLKAIKNSRPPLIEVIEL